MTLLNEIQYADWQFKLNEIGSVAEGVDDINQCIGIILTTPKGTVPHRPTFGSYIYKYIDYPVNSAKPNIIRETIDALSEWEKRVIVKSVSYEADEENVKVNVEWQLKDSTVVGNAEVTL